MAIDDTLDGLYVGADHAVVLTVYSDTAQTTCQDIAGWTLVLDIRKTDTAPTALLSATGVVSGTFDADPAVNTQVATFTLSDDDLAAATFPGDDPTRRYSIKRTDAGFEQPVRFGDVTLGRVTQT
ncbi:MAG: hypothetical protein OEW98_00220 [Betaproteobacteria bacterium]|nr:hypothetical protein [Betaproteobacteria bacterium]